MILVRAEDVAAVISGANTQALTTLANWGMFFGNTPRNSDMS